MIILVSSFSASHRWILSLNFFYWIKFLFKKIIEIPHKSWTKMNTMKNDGGLEDHKVRWVGGKCFAEIKFPLNCVGEQWNPIIQNIFKMIPCNGCWLLRSLLARNLPECQTYLREAFWRSSGANHRTTKMIFNSSS